MVHYLMTSKVGINGGFSREVGGVVKTTKKAVKPK